MTLQPDLWSQATRGSIEDRYLAWKSREGERVAQIKAALLHAWQRGEHRLSVALVFELIRRDYGLSLNNSMRAPLVTELLREHPELKDRIETRRRRSL